MWQAGVDNVLREDHRTHCPFFMLHRGSTIMKVHMHPERRARRGTPVKVGNVYAVKGTADYALVVAVIPRGKQGFRDEYPWNNVISLRIDALGSIIGCDRHPQDYVSNHRDLVGEAIDMPDFSIKWLEELNA